MILRDKAKLFIGHVCGHNILPMLKSASHSRARPHASLAVEVVSQWPALMGSWIRVPVGMAKTPPPKAAFNWATSPNRTLVALVRTKLWAPAINHKKQLSMNWANNPVVNTARPYDLCVHGASIVKWITTSLRYQNCPSVHKTVYCLYYWVLSWDKTGI